LTSSRFKVPSSKLKAKCGYSFPPFSKGGLGGILSTLENPPESPFRKGGLKDRLRKSPVEKLP
jgi:hypothetical protein